MRKKKILLSNDDGVHAPGIRFLKKRLEKDYDITIVAPLEERSTTGHTLTLDHPIRLVEIEDRVFGCSGFPADCTLFGLRHVMKNDPPDIVISGINKGANLGQDIYYSGTVAAAREATFHGFKSIAISSVMDFHSESYDQEGFESAAEIVARLLKHDIDQLIKQGEVININVPSSPFSAIKGLKVTKLGFRRYSEEISERTDFRGRKYFWIGGKLSGFEGDSLTDCYALDEGLVSFSSLKVIGDHSDESKQWREYFNKNPLI